MVCPTMATRAAQAALQGRLVPRGGVAAVVPDRRGIAWGLYEMTEGGFMLGSLCDEAHSQAGEILLHTNSHFEQ